MQSKMESFPRDIFFNIFSKLPLNTVIRSSCVSKSWLNMIKDPSFVKLYISLSKPEPSLLILTHRVIGGRNIISICPLKHEEFKFVIDGTAINHMVSSVTFDLVGTCNGLLCFTSSSKNEVTMVCNPITREHVTLPQPSFTPSPNEYARMLGFGFDHVAKKYKVVRMLYPRSIQNAAGHAVGPIMDGMGVVDELVGPENHLVQARGQLLQADERADMRASVMRAEVYTLGTDTWREVQGINCHPRGRAVHANGFVYWLLNNHTVEILSFDFGSERFKLTTPNHRFGRQVGLAELGGLLAVVDVSRDLVEILVLKDPAINSWELQYILPIHNPRTLDHQSPRLICAHEFSNVVVVWLQDSIISYDSRAYRTRDLKIAGFPIWLDWEICSGYRESLVPLRNLGATINDVIDDVQFLDDVELHSLYTKGGEFGERKPNVRCSQLSDCFGKNGLLL